MENAITAAARAAGLPVKPLNRLAWQWLADHAPLHKTANEVALALKVNPQNARNALSDLAHRGMVTSQLTRSFKSRGPRQVHAYAAVGKIFELLPAKPRRPVAAPLGPLMPSPPPAPPIKLNEVDIMNMKLSEARALYDKLKEIFG